MFGFNKKKLTAEEKIQWDNEVKELIAKEDFENAAKKVKEYEKLDRDAASYYLAILHYTGKGLKQDLERALYYIEIYTDKHSEDPEGWFYGSNILLAANKREEAVEWLFRAEKMGREGTTKYLADFCSFIGMNFYNAACLTLKINERKSMNIKAVLYFIAAIQKYGKVYQENPSSLSEEDWIQFGYDLHYLHYLALNSPLPKYIYVDKQIGADIAAYYDMKEYETNDHTIEYWMEVAEKVLADMEKEGHLVPAAYTKAMMASNAANLNKSQEGIAKAKEYLDQATALAGDQDAKYRDIYEVVWDEYERLVKKQERGEKKGLFGGFGRK